MKNNNRLAVYTAIFGDYDSLIDHNFEDTNVDFYCFTDQELKSDKWTIIKYDKDNELDPVRCSRKCKINSHLLLPDYGLTLWHDANLKPLAQSARELVTNLLVDHHIAITKHPIRNCIYDEAQACLDLLLDYPGVIKRQINKYKKIGFPRNYGLAAAGFIARRNNSITKNFNQQWWKKVMMGSRRDQLSFDYIRWRLKTPVNFIDYPVYEYLPHLNDKNRSIINK